MIHAACLKIFSCARQISVTPTEMETCLRPEVTPAINVACNLCRNKITRQSVLQDSIVLLRLNFFNELQSKLLLYDWPLPGVQLVGAQREKQREKK